MQCAERQFVVVHHPLIKLQAEQAARQRQPHQGLVGLDAPLLQFRAALVDRATEPHVRVAAPLASPKEPLPVHAEQPRLDAVEQLTTLLGIVGREGRIRMRRRAKFSPADRSLSCLGPYRMRSARSRLVAHILIASYSQRRSGCAAVSPSSSSIRRANSSTKSNRGTRDEIVSPFGQAGQVLYQFLQRVPATPKSFPDAVDLLIDLVGLLPPFLSFPEEVS